MSSVFDGSTAPDKSKVGSSRHRQGHHCALVAPRKSQVEVTSLHPGEWQGGTDRRHVLIVAVAGPGARLLGRGVDVGFDAEVGEGLVTFLPAGMPWRIVVPAISPAATAITVPEDLIVEVCGEDAEPWRHAVAEPQARIADTVKWIAESRLDAGEDRDLVVRLLGRLIASNFGTFARRMDDSWLPAAALVRIASLGASPSTLKRLSVPMLAGHAGLGVSAFSRGFRGSTGLTPGEYLIQVRMGQIARLLDSTELPIVAIAERTGLAGVAHLTQQFGQRFGMSPGRYRSAAICAALPGS